MFFAMQLSLITTSVATIEIISPNALQKASSNVANSLMK